MALSGRRSGCSSLHVFRCPWCPAGVFVRRSSAVQMARRRRRYRFLSFQTVPQRCFTVAPTVPGYGSRTMCVARRRRRYGWVSVEFLHSLRCLAIAPVVLSHGSGAAHMARPRRQHVCSSSHLRPSWRPAVLNVVLAQGSSTVRLMRPWRNQVFFSLHLLRSPWCQAIVPHVALAYDIIRDELARPGRDHGKLVRVLPSRRRCPGVVLDHSTSTVQI